VDTKDVRIDCPCCESRLEIDVRSGKVLRWSKKGESDEAGKPVVRESDWGTASERVAKRLGTATDKFDDSLKREQTRSRDLDDLFRKASKKLEPGDEG
jgi:hypothetical protein